MPKWALSAALLLFPGVASSQELAPPLTLPPQPNTDPMPLGVGDPAPPLEGVTWHLGSGPAKLQAGTIYVIDFWATWCKPCIALMPHMSEIQTKYADKNVKVLGVAIWESTRELRPGDSHAQQVARFLDEKREVISYAAGYAGDDSPIPQQWMAAARRVSIPTVFVVDADTKIAWIGHPSNGLDEALAALAAGNFDALAWDNKSRAADQRRRRGMILATELQRAVQASDYATALAKADEILAIDRDIFSLTAVSKFQLLRKLNREDDAKAWLQTVRRDYPDDEAVHTQLAGVFLFDQDGSKRDPANARVALDRARAIARTPGMNLEFLRAELLHQEGKTADAIELAEQLSQRAQEPLLSQLREQLDRFRHAEPSALIPGGG
jgi:thiol-disulfide isomerase/thioredoxin